MGVRPWVVGKIARRDWGKEAQEGGKEGAKMAVSAPWIALILRPDSGMPGECATECIALPEIPRRFSVIYYIMSLSSPRTTNI